MRRLIARWQVWWLRLFVVAIVAAAVLPVPRPVDLLTMAVPFGLFLVRPPRSARAPVDVAPPVRGRWAAVNSPGSKVPSHGVRAYGQTYAVDLVQPSADREPTIGWSLRTRGPDGYPAFGEPVVAMAPGTVVGATDRQRDHRARNTWPAFVWMMTVEAFLRELAGAPYVLGNHVIVEHDDGTWAAYAHLRRGSLTTRRGQRVCAGDRIAAVGNTGNSFEPHLHVQLMDDPSPTAAAGVPMSWTDARAEPGDVDPRWVSGPPRRTAVPGFPPNGQIVTVP